MSLAIDFLRLFCYNTNHKSTKINTKKAQLHIMKSPADLARFYENRTPKPEGLIYSSGKVDASIGSTIDTKTRQDLEALKRQLLNEAMGVFGIEYNEGEVRETYDALEGMLDLVAIEGSSGSSAHAMMFSAHGDGEGEGGSRGIKGDGSDDEPESRLADKYIVRVIYGGDGDVTGMLAGPVPYAHGNAIFVSRDLRCRDTVNLAIGATPGTVTRTEFCEQTGAARVYHRGTPEEVQGRVVKLLSMEPEAFVAEVEARKERAVKRRLAQRAAAPADSLIA